MCVIALFYLQTSLSRFLIIAFSNQLLSPSCNRLGRRWRSGCDNRCKIYRITLLLSIWIDGNWANPSSFQTWANLSRNIYLCMTGIQFSALPLAASATALTSEAVMYVQCHVNQRQHFILFRIHFEPVRSWKHSHHEASAVNFYFGVCCFISVLVLSDKL